MRHNRAVCSSNLFASLDRRNAFERISRLGFRYVDLWASPLISAHLQLLDDDMDEVHADLAEAHLQVTSVTGFLLTDEERSQLLPLSAELGSDYVVIEPGPSADWPAVMSNLQAPGRLIGSPDQNLGEYLDIIDPLADEALTLGMKICLEVPHVATVISDRKSIEAFLSDPRSAKYGLTFAPPHLALAEDDLRSTVDQLSDRIDMFYLWNVKPGYRGAVDGRAYGTGSQQLSSRGELDIRSVADRLHKREKPLDFVIAAHGTESNPNGDEVQRMVEDAILQLPEAMQAELRETAAGRAA